MSDEPVETYEPVPEFIADGGVLIADPVEFFDTTNGVAAIVRDGGLWVLRRGTLKWKNVEDMVRVGPRSAK